MGKGKRFKGYYVIYVIHDPSTVRPGSCGRKRPRPKCGCTVDYKKRCKYYGVDELEVIDLVSLACGREFAGDVEHAWADWFGYWRGNHYRNNWNNSQTTE